MRSLWIVSLLVFVTLPTIATAGFDAEPGVDRNFCRSTRGTTIVATRTARVYVRTRNTGTRRYACLRSIGTGFAIDKPNECEFAQNDELIVLAGNLVGYYFEADDCEGLDPKITALDVRVMDLRTGKLRMIEDARSRGLKKVVLRPTGSVAWIAYVDHDNDDDSVVDEPTDDVPRLFKRDAGSRRAVILDTSAAIRRLTLRGSRLTWTDAQNRHKKAKLR